MSSQQSPSVVDEGRLPVYDEGQFLLKAGSCLTSSQVIPQNPSTGIKGGEKAFSLAVFSKILNHSIVHGPYHVCRSWHEKSRRFHLVANIDDNKEYKKINLR